MRRTETSLGNVFQHSPRAFRISLALKTCNFCRLR
jgi:hypothetical protein